MPAPRRIRSVCTCPDREWAAVCKHIAAVAFVVADALDRDPSLLLRWRGCEPVEPPASRSGDPWRAGPLPPPRPPRSLPPGAVVKRLGRSGIRVGGDDLADALEPAYRAFAALSPTRPCNDRAVEQRLSLVTLGVTDLDAARRFYEALGWTETPRAEGVVFFQAGGMVVGLWSRTRPRRGQRRRRRRRLGRRDARLQHALARGGRHGDRGGSGRRRDASRASRARRSGAATRASSSTSTGIRGRSRTIRPGRLPRMARSSSEGYSGTPLARKLGIVEGGTFAVVADPGHAEELLAPLPSGAQRIEAVDEADVVVLFTTARADLAERLGALGAAVFPDGALWIAWPKRASKVPTDMTEDVVREVALPLGLVDTKVAAVDATWSGLRLVWRLDRRKPS